MSEKVATGRICLITGAASGIGRAVSKTLAGDSCGNTIIMADMDELNLQGAVEVVSAGKHANATVASITMDITHLASIRDGAKLVSKQYGHLDVLMNNAGIYRSNLPLENDLLTHFHTNVVGNAQVTETFTPLLKKAPKGAYVLYTSSGLGSLKESSPGGRFAGDLLGWETIGYRVSKAALNMVAVEDARKLRQCGIKVFAVCPGLVESNIRGTLEEERTARGKAGSAGSVGPFVQSILAGNYDSHVGGFIRDGGVWDW
ncbi:short-chain dehydrogenase/reductase trope [Acrodontium crateriforme]|uniref:Short-chain dehydrogenase/reductase trope n=1 Tax=Acrodontium crateriforme TaxID=150365 RepID=A0AAQ3RCH1_9PEZI|nr:short-chain dehydrogenase/reductase trope [Acrodontium crateriforme]